MATDKLVDFDHVTDYISRDAALFAVVDAVQSNDNGFRWGEIVTFTGGDIIKLIKSIPAADVRPVVRGEWEKHEDFDHYGGGRFVEWVCSECDKRLRGDWATRNHIEETPTENFCPNCGADMREGS